MVPYSSESLPKDERKIERWPEENIAGTIRAAFFAKGSTKCGPSLYGSRILEHLEVPASLEQDDVLFTSSLKWVALNNAILCCDRSLREWGENVWLIIGSEDDTKGYQDMATKSATYAPHIKAPMTPEASGSTLSGSVRSANFGNGDGGSSIIS